MFKIPLFCIFILSMCFGHAYHIDMYFGEPTHLAGGLMTKMKKTFHPSDFVETGTYLGESAELGAKYFNTVYTVEIFKEAYDQASARLQRYANVHCFHDNSLNFLKQNGNFFSEKSLFWLDAHYSGLGTGTLYMGEDYVKSPLKDEIAELMSNFKSHYVILIDDIRGYINVPDYMRSNRDYPTVKELYHVVKEHNKNARFYILGDQALIYDGLTYNLSVSPQVKACSTSFLFDAYHKPSDREVTRVLKAEKKIAQTWSNKKLDKALDRLYAAYVTNGKDSISYYASLWMGLRKIHKKDYKSALADFQRLIDQTILPPHGRIYLYMSICYKKLGDNQKAKEYLDKVDAQTIRCNHKVYRWSSL
ncbi:MAG: hypothetical protein HY860_03870 [Chlamydiales bacterium]|nr:hypothetical protein [Chlamydiales bacterium]